MVKQHPDGYFLKGVWFDGVHGSMSVNANGSTVGNIYDFPHNRSITTNDSCGCNNKCDSTIQCSCDICNTHEYDTPYWAYLAIGMCLWMLIVIALGMALFCV